MKLSLYTALTLLCVCVASPFSSDAFTEGAEAEWAVDMSTVLHEVSDDMWGIFWEEIGWSGQGGLYQQQVMNSNFESNSADYGPWQVVSTHSTPPRVVVQLTQEYPLNAFNPTALQVTSQSSKQDQSIESSVNRNIASNTHTSDEEQQVRLINPGFMGINLLAHQVFNFTAFVKSDSVKEIVVQIVSIDLTFTYAQNTIPVTNNWSEQSVLLHANNRSDHAAALLLSWPSDSIMLLDVITLMPTTGWRTLPFMRADLADLIADLQPSSVRVPGGCIVEGGRLGNFFNWKRALGPVAERKGIYNDVWDYYTETQFGTLEFLQWAEQMTDPRGDTSRLIFVINAGISHSDTISQSHLSGWVQDALDSVDFIRGDASSTHWGRKRASLGRVEPFLNFKYLAIGNEDCKLPNYDSNYQIFYDALSASHPDLILISNCRPEDMSHPDKVKLFDYHTYPSSTEFLQLAKQWDSYSRASSVYVSEYATHGGQGKGNMRAALAEGIFMLGMERNADIIKMAAFAPLLTNTELRPINFQQLVLFRHNESYGTASYYVQKMFSLAVRGTQAHSTFTLNHILSLPADANVSVSPIIAALNSSTQVVILKVINYDGQTVSLNVHLLLPPKWQVSGLADVNTLSSDSLDVENSYESPRRVVDHSRQQKVQSADFTITLDRFSLTIWRVYVDTKVESARQILKRANTKVETVISNATVPPLWSS